MKPGNLNSPAKAKNLARQIAKKIAAEPLEILKTAGQQVSGEEAAPPSPTGQVDQKGLPPKQAEGADKLRQKDLRRVQALEQEMKDIREQRKLKQRQKLEEEENQQIVQKPQELPHVASKPSRRFLGFGQKQSAQKLQTRVEKPIPPSG